MDFLLLGVAVAFICIGLVFLVFMLLNWRKGYAEIISYVTWFFLSVGVALFLFRIFDVGSSAGGTIYNITIGGGFAGFVLIWWLASRWSSQAHQRAEGAREVLLQKDVAQLTAKKQEMANKLAQVNVEINSLKQQRQQDAVDLNRYKSLEHQVLGILKDGEKRTLEEISAILNKHKFVDIGDISAAINSLCRKNDASGFGGRYSAR